MEILNLLYQAFVAYIIAAPVVGGAIMVLFNRRVSLLMLRSRKAMLKRDYTEFDVKMGRVYAVVIGAVVLIAGLMNAVQLLF